MDEEIKRRTARRKCTLVLDIIQGQITVSQSSRQFDLPPSEIESWIDHAKAGMETPCWRRRRSTTLHIQQGLKADGFTVPMTKLG
jgi:hypothetical protein